MTQNERKIGVAFAIVFTLVIILVSVSIYYFYGNRNSLVTTSSTTTRSFICCVTTEQITNNFSVLGTIPYLVASPQNHTFTLVYNVTTFDNPLNLTYDQAYSYAVLYSNNTQWVSSSRPCETSAAATNSQSSAVSYSTTNIVVTTAPPCGSASGEWYPVNGSVVSSHLNINASNVQMTIQPSNIAAHSAKQVEFTISISMQPGVYAINLGVDMKVPGSPLTQYLLGYTPLIVT